MEETITPDITISKAICKIGDKIYNLYCKRDTKKQAEIIRDDLITNKYDAFIRQVKVNEYSSYLVWWRKL